MKEIWRETILFLETKKKIVFSSELIGTVLIFEHLHRDFVNVTIVILLDDGSENDSNARSETEKNFQFRQLPSMGTNAFNRLNQPVYVRASITCSELPSYKRTMIETQIWETAEP